MLCHVCQSDLVIFDDRNIVYEFYVQHSDLMMMMMYQVDVQF